MVTTFGSNIVSAFTNGTSVKAIYANGVRVWPVSNSYYITWTPSDLTGTFTIDGSTYNLEDYGGSFSWSTGVIDVSAFKNTGIETVETNAWYIRQYAFASCSSLSQVSLSACKNIEARGFNKCEALTDVYAPVLSGLGAYGFAYCSSLVSIELPMCSAVWNNAFASCGSLECVSLPACESLGTQTFVDNHVLSSVYLPECSRLEGWVFYNVSANASIYLPKCEYVDGAFRKCNAQTIELPVCSYIGLDTFNNTSVKTIVLGYSSVCTLVSSTSQYVVFHPSGHFADGTGSIYVPASLVDAYKSATNWSIYSSLIFPISEPTPISVQYARWTLLYGRVLQ